jgi:hypothetical protein
LQRLQDCTPIDLELKPTEFLRLRCMQIVEACMASRSLNGGMYELDALTRAVNRRRGTQVDPVTADDVVGCVQLR